MKTYDVYRFTGHGDASEHVGQLQARNLEEATEKVQEQFGPEAWVDLADGSDFDLKQKAIT